MCPRLKSGTVPLLDKASPQNGYEGREGGVYIGDIMKVLRRSLFILGIYMASLLVIATPAAVSNTHLTLPTNDLV